MGLRGNAPPPRGPAETGAWSGLDRAKKTADPCTWAGTITWSRVRHETVKSSAPPGENLRGGLHMLWNKHLRRKSDRASRKCAPDPKKGPSERSSGRRNIVSPVPGSKPLPLREPHAPRRRGKATCGVQRSGLVPTPPASGGSLRKLALGLDQPSNQARTSSLRRARRSGLVPTPQASDGSLPKLALGLDTSGNQARPLCFGESKEAGPSRPRKRRPPHSLSSPSASTSTTTGLGFRTSPSRKRRARPDPVSLGRLAPEARPRPQAAQQPGSGYVLRRLLRSVLVRTPHGSPS